MASVRLAKFVQILKSEGVEDEDFLKAVTEAAEEIYEKMPTGEVAKRGPSNYNLFYAAENARLKKENPKMSGAERKLQINTAWSAQKKTRKPVAQADPAAGVAVAVVEKKTKKPLTGFNLFVQNKVKIEKVPMGEASKIWKGLSDEAKAEWKQKAVAAAL